MMSDAARSGDLDGLTPSQLVALVDGLDPHSAGPGSVDLDAIARSIDPGKLRRDELTTLLTAIGRLGEAGTGLDLGSVGADTFARLIAGASKAQIQAFMLVPSIRKMVLDQVFLHRMPAHLRAERTKDMRAVAHFRLTGGSGEGGYDRYEVVIDHGACHANTEPASTAKATITLAPAEFLKLITRNASAPVLFMTGKLKVRGDLAFAAGMMGLFDLPTG
jgi:putative sterol carrier protein